MKKAIAVTLGLALSTQVVLAQPAPMPAPAPPEVEDPAHPVKPVPDKAGTNETLNQGQNDVRPWASGVSSSEQQTALGIFRDGNAQLNDGFFVKAAEKYREALKHWDHPAISYNLALALMNLDQPIEVYESLQKSVRFGVGPLEKDKFEHANEYMVLVSKQLADIEVSCDKPGAKVSVDGKVVFQAPGTFKSRVRIGKHTFFAEKQGYTAHIGAPFIGPGEKFRIELKLYTAEELTRYHRKWDATWMPWAVAGAGVVIAGAGLGLNFLAKSKYDDFDTQVELCSMNNSGCTITPDLQSTRDRGDLYKTMSYVAFGVGGAAVVTGLAMAYVNRRMPYQIRADEYESEQARQGVVFAPVVAPGVAGAAVMGHF